MEIEKVVSIIKQVVNQEASITVSTTGIHEQFDPGISTIITIELNQIGYQKKFFKDRLKNDACALHDISDFLRHFSSLFVELNYQLESKK